MSRESGSIQLLDAAVAESTVQKIGPTWAPDVDGLLQKEVEKLDAEILALKGADSAPPIPPSVIGVQIEIARLKELVAKDEVSRKRLLDLQKQIAELWDYVIVHELLHFSVPNHGKLWKSLMRLHLGEYEAHEGELKRIAGNKAPQRTRCASC